MDEFAVADAATFEGQLQRGRGIAPRRARHVPGAADDPTTRVSADSDNAKLRMRCYIRPKRAPVADYCKESAVRLKRRRNAKAALPPCCLDYQRRLGTRQLCPQHEQRAEAHSDHLRRLQRPEVFGKLRDAFGPGASGPERTWGYDSAATANPDDGSTTDHGNPSKKTDATTKWLSEHDKAK